MAHTVDGAAVPGKTREVYYWTTEREHMATKLVNHLQLGADKTMQQVGGRTNRSEKNSNSFGT
jgi:hypothetical protein